MQSDVTGGRRRRFCAAVRMQQFCDVFGSFMHLNPEHSIRKM
jgi:hypothetical protein